MTKDWVIYGAGNFANTIKTLLESTGENVISFIVDDEFLGAQETEPPIHSASCLDEIFAADSYALSIGLGYTNINSIRRERYSLLKAMGYQLYNVISPYACVLSDSDPSDSLIVFEQAIVQPHVNLGSNIIIRSGANIGHHSVVGDHSFIAAGAVTGGSVSIGKQSFIGLGAVIRDNIKIADRCFIGAGAVVVKDTEPDGVYIGNPAKRIDKTSMEVTSG